VNKKSINEIAEIIIGAAIAVHKELGPGLLESTYEACLIYELVQSGLKVESQKSLRLLSWSSDRLWISN
jgi:GxxExxY protein